MSEMKKPEEVIAVHGEKFTDFPWRDGEPWLFARHLIQTLDAAGYVIVNRDALNDVLLAALKSEKLAEHIVDELTQERAGT